jgi:hypothetical protein
MLNSNNGSNGTGANLNNKKFLYNTKDAFRPKVLAGGSKQNVLIKTENTPIKKKEQDEIQIKIRSPLMYNRHKLPNSTKNINPEEKTEKIKVNLSEGKSLLKPTILSNEKNFLEKIKEDENRAKLIEIELKNEKLENEIRLLKMVRKFILKIIYY